MRTLIAISRMCELLCCKYSSSGGRTRSGGTTPISFFISLRLLWRITILLSANFSISLGTIVDAMASESGPFRIWSPKRSSMSEVICSEVSEILKLVSSRNPASSWLNAASVGTTCCCVLLSMLCSSFCSSEMACPRSWKLPPFLSCEASLEGTKPNSRPSSPPPSPSVEPPSYAARSAGGRLRTFSAKSASPKASLNRARACRAEPATASMGSRRWPATERMSSGRSSEAPSRGVDASDKKRSVACRCRQSAESRPTRRSASTTACASRVECMYATRACDAALRTTTLLSLTFTTSWLSR
mmetsp:Transcript_19082/g.47696  ORF Transcript_19082/g.47696 Transcript_19082/m.47696 type:complete len:301 (+) Transcript_19082:444-1346(+)